MRKTSGYLTQALTLTILLIAIGCGGKSDTNQFDFNIADDTLEVNTLVEGLDSPTGLALDFDSVDFKDQLFVSESGKGRVVAVDNEGGLTTIATDLTNPGSILFDIIADSFLVLETQSNQVTRVDFSQQPPVSLIFAALPQGVFPVDIASDGEFRYVAARNTTKVNQDQVYNINTNSPQLIAEGFQRVGGVAYRLLDEEPQLLVTDTKAGSVLMLRLEQTEDSVVKKFKELVRDLDNPTAIAIGPASEFIYICESGANRVIRATSNGSQTEVVAKIASPSGLLFDNKGNLYVSSNQEGKVFKITGLKEVLN